MESETRTTTKKFPDYKCLRRNIRLKTDNDNQFVFTKIKIKKLYFSTVTHEIDDHKLKYFLTGKQGFCLKHLRLKIGKKEEYLGMLRGARNLKSFGLTSQSRINVWNMLSCVKRLSKNIQEIYLTSKLKQLRVSETTPLYRHLSALRHLKSVRREIPHLGLEFENVQKEYEIRHRYLSKLKHLEQFFPTSQFYLKKALQEDKVFPFQKVLVLEFTDVTIVQGTDLMALLNELQRKMNGGYDEEELQRDIDETAPLFKFNLFPNLREVIVNFGEGTLRLVKPFLVDAFKTFNKKLKLFRSKVACKSYETSQPIFNALLQLPVLDSFDFEFYPWEKANSKLLVQCLQKQPELVSLFLAFPGFRYTKTDYNKQSHFLKNIHTCLNNKPNLKYLTLDMNHWNLESLSEGLRKTEHLKQLQDLTINVFDDHISTKLSASDRVKGLIDFLIIHKRTLRSLTIFLLFVCEDEVLDSLIRTISELTELKALHLKVNDRNEAFTGEYLKLYSQESEELLNQHLSLKHTFSCLDQTLRRLTKLSDLTVEIYLVNRKKVAYTRSSINSSVVFNALPSLKSLRWFLLSLPFLNKAVKKHPAQGAILSELKGVKGMVIQDTQLDEMEVKELKDITAQFHKKQSLRCEIMF